MTFDEIKAKLATGEGFQETFSRALRDKVRAMMYSLEETVLARTWTLGPWDENELVLQVHAKEFGTCHHCVNS